MKTLINSALGLLDAKIVRKSIYEKLVSSAKRSRDYELLEKIDEEHAFEYLQNLPFSKSQLRQDLFVLSELGFKRNGFFVEFGATDGVKLSNSHILETRFDWDGILAEPARLWHTSLRENRLVAIETDCVWRTTGDTLLFNEVIDSSHEGELSTIDSFSDADHHRAARHSSSKKYEVKTISLKDMLEKHDAPKKIDYLSIDTEGSEFDILSNFDFNEYDITVITCEHNYTPMREKLHRLLSNYGYKRKLTELSFFDDWYVKR